MTKRLMQKSDRQIELWVLVALFGICLLMSLIAVVQGWSGSLLDMHGFRQTQTAISAEYLLRGGPFFQYETPVFGPPWSIPLEFPFYQGLVAVLCSVLGWDLVETGRLVSVLFFYLSLFPVFFLLKEWEVKIQHRFLFLSLIVISPIFIFWSRTFMIETTAVFFSVSYLFYVVKFCRSKDLKNIFWALPLGVLGGLIKITTLFGFAFAALLVVMPVLMNLRKTQNFRSGALLLFKIAALFVVPLAFVLAWTHYADSIKLLNPLAGGIVSSNMTDWNFGTLQQKLSVDAWWRFIFERTLRDISGAPEVVFGALVLSFLAGRKYGVRVFLSFLCFLIVPAVFTNLHFEHNYYPVANALFALAAVGFCLVGLLERGGKWRILLALSLFLFAGFSSFERYTEFFLRFQKNAFRFPAEFIETVNTRVAPEDVLLIYGADWSSELPFYLRRRAVMDTADRDLQDPNIHASLENIKKSGLRLGGALVCHRSLTNENVRKNLSELKFDQMIIASKSVNCILAVP